MSENQSPIFDETKANELKNSFANFICNPNKLKCMSHLQTQLSELATFNKREGPALRAHLLTILNTSLLLLPAAAKVQIKKQYATAVLSAPKKATPSKQMNMLAQLSNPAVLGWSNLYSIVDEIEEIDSPIMKKVRAAEENFRGLEQVSAKLDAKSAKGKAINGFINETQQARKNYFLKAVQPKFNNDLSPINSEIDNSQFTNAMDKHGEELGKHRTTNGFLRNLEQAFTSIIAFFSPKTKESYIHAKAETGVTLSKFYAGNIVNIFTNNRSTEEKEVGKDVRAAKFSAAAV